MDCITWSPAGRILQVEYAMEAVKQGTPVLGLRSKACVVLVSFKRAQSELAQHQQKIFKIDDHMAIGISGLTADARVLADYMRNECLNHRYVYDAAMNVGRLVAQVADKSQQKTQNSSKRPYGAPCPHGSKHTLPRGLAVCAGCAGCRGVGFLSVCWQESAGKVGLLVAGCDEKGPHLYETCPSGNYFESLGSAELQRSNLRRRYYAMAIGGRSTSAKTYLEKHFADFETADVDALVKHGLEAMNKTTSSDQSLTTKNTAVAVMETGGKYRELSSDELQKVIDSLEKKAEDEPMPDEPTPAAESAESAAPMDTT
ncbi:Psma1 [Symbiodinium natans]|uniref:Psma1 protein n=1 Tax=Symbiodinium natans TaxID=878477 RepID=A0A812PWB7_9DINO|nr:Psma1 [Symbiodinium natans]